MRNYSKHLLISLTIGVFGNCSQPEPEESNFIALIKNESENTLSIRGFNPSNELIINDNLNSSDSSESCNYFSEIFQGYSSSKCDIDSLVIEFNNGKGYICVDRIGNINPYCFSNTINPISGGEGFNDLGNNRYEFVITEEDFNNAHELPE